MDNDARLDHITTTTCDSCGSHGPALLLHALGAPVLATCMRCDPRAFETHARADIDAWLNGGKNQA